MKEQIAHHAIPRRATAYQTTRQPAVQTEYEVEDGLFTPHEATDFVAGKGI